MSHWFSGFNYSIKLLILNIYLSCRPWLRWTSFFMKNPQGLCTLSISHYSSSAQCLGFQPGHSPKGVASLGRLELPDPSQLIKTSYNSVCLVYQILISQHTPYFQCLLHQFSSVAQSCPALCDPMDCSMPGFPVLHYPLQFAQTHTVHWVSNFI